MLVLYIFILMFTNSINHLKKNIHSTFINRITIITLFICIFYTFNTLYFQTIGKGISLYSGLYQTTVQSNLIEILLIIVGICILFAWPHRPFRPLKEASAAPRLAVAIGKDTRALSLSKRGGREAAPTDTSPAKHSMTREAIKTTDCSSCSATLCSSLPSLPLSESGGRGVKDAGNKTGIVLDPNSQTLPYSPLFRTQGSLFQHSDYLPSLPLSESGGPRSEREVQLFAKGVKMEVDSAGLSLIKTDQYSLIALFSILGGTLLMSSLDLLSMYLSIELQSFALYILATLNKERLSATNAGLKYFLLGSLSSCFILLGSAIIYSYTGLTQFEAIHTLMSCISPSSVAFAEIDAFAPFVGPVDASPFILREGDGLLNGWKGHTILQEFSTLSASLSLGQVFSFGQGGEQLFLNNINKAFYIGFVIIIIGFLFKISAAPFYQWAPDVYDGTPTIVTVWLTIVVKLTILVFLLGFIDLCFTDNKFISSQAFYYTFPLALQLTENLTLGTLQIKNLLLISSVLSLLIGTIVGLKQIKVKRLLAFSSISHVGFLLLALGIYTQKSVDSFIFYLVQYSVTSLNIFLILLAFGYLLAENSNNLNKLNHSYPSIASRTLYTFPLGSKATKEINGNFFSNSKAEGDINFLIELKGQIYKNPVLSISLAICLFSMAGIPPLIGFFSKQFVLFSSIENGYNFLSIVAILVSVISASYYLRIIKITFFEKKSEAVGEWREEAKNLIFSLQSHSKRNDITNNLTNVHSYIVAILTFLILFFFLDPSILLNGTQLISLTIFNI